YPVIRCSIHRNHLFAILATSLVRLPLSNLALHAIPGASMSKNSPANSRRNFLRAGLFTTVASATYPALGAARVVDQSPNPDVLPREFELDELTIDDLQQAMQSGKYSSRSLTEKYLARIQEIDKGGPRINSVIEVNPEALEISEG